MLFSDKVTLQQPCNYDSFNHGRSEALRHSVLNISNKSAMHG